MTATKPNWRRQFVTTALPCLLLPKCFACLHIYAWGVAWLFGTQVELCGPATLTWPTIVTELGIVATLALLVRWLIRTAMPCSRSCAD